MVTTWEFRNHPQSSQKWKPVLSRTAGSGQGGTARLCKEETCKAGGGRVGWRMGWFSWAISGYWWDVYSIYTIHYQNVMVCFSYFRNNIYIYICIYTCTHMIGGFHKWGYPQSSSTSDWDVPLQTIQLLGYPHDWWKTPIWSKDVFNHY